MCVYTKEGIVMAADSRIIIRDGQNQPVTISDSTYKLFLAPNGVGISTTGQAHIDFIPIAGYIESFINEKLKNSQVEADQAAQLLLNYFCALPNPPSASFYVSGYINKANVPEQYVSCVVINSNIIERKSDGNLQGAVWNGDHDIFDRLMSQFWKKDVLDNYSEIPPANVQWNYLSLQDAIDFATYAIRVTIDSMRFQMRAKTVGGAIDILVIKPREAFWVKRKKLKVTD
jgi:20S proteasome alpha/beta subunit